MPGAPPPVAADGEGVQGPSVAMTMAEMEKMRQLRSRSDEHSTTNLDVKKTLIREELDGSKLWLGNADDAEDLEALKRDRITHILNCADDVEPPAFLSSGEFTYLQLEISDTPSAAETLRNNLEQGIKFIDTGLLKGSVLVHCHLGRSRSASLVIAFLVARRGCSYEEALTELKEKRQLYGGALVEPNEGFKQVLTEFAAEEAVKVTASMGGGHAAGSGIAGSLASGYKSLIGLCCGTSQEQA